MPSVGCDGGTLQSIGKVSTQIHHNATQMHYNRTLNRCAKTGYGFPFFFRYDHGMQKQKKDSGEPCLVCKRTDQPLKRGLCPADYERFRRSKNKAKSKEEELLFEEALVAKGLLAPDARISVDPFAEVLAEVREVSDAYTVDSAKAAAAEAAKQRKTVQRHTKKRKGG